MDTREVFKKAFSNVQSLNSFPEHEKALKDVLERANNMNDNENIRQIKYGSKAPVYDEPTKPHTAWKVVGGIAGAAAVLTGGFFGLKFLNDHGGLKGPDAGGPGAGYSENADTTTADTDGNEFTTIFQSYSRYGSGYAEVDQRYGVGDDVTVHLKGYKFDGTWAKIYYDVIYKEDIMGGEIKQIAPKETENGHTESLEYAINANYAYCTANYKLDTPADSVYVEFGYKEEPHSEIFGMMLQKTTEQLDEPVFTTAIVMTTPDVDATTVTAEEYYALDAETTTTATAEWDDTDSVASSAIALELPDEDTTGSGWVGETSLGFKDKDIDMTAFRYDGRFLEARLVGSEEDLCHVAVRSSTRGRNIIQGMGRYDEETGSAVFFALLDVPAGEYDRIDFIDLGAVNEVGYPVAGSSVTIKGVDNCEPLMERVGLDMTEYGIPDATLEWLTLSPVGLEMSFTSKKKNAFSTDIKIERTSLNGTVVRFSGYYASTVYDESTGLYHTSMVVTPDDYNVDLLKMKEFSINGLKTKRAEFMAKSFWDTSSEPDMNELQPVETAVQISYPD